MDVLFYNLQVMARPDRGGLGPAFNFDEINEPSVDTTLALQEVFAQFEGRATTRDEVGLDIVYGNIEDKEGMQIYLRHEIENTRQLSTTAYISLLRQDIVMFPLHECASDTWGAYFAQMEQVNDALKHWQQAMASEEISWTSGVLDMLVQEDDPSDILGTILTRPDQSIGVCRYTQKRRWSYENEFRNTDGRYIRFQRFAGDMPIVNIVDGERSELERQVDIRQPNGRMYLYHGYTNGKVELSVQRDRNDVVEPESDGPRVIDGTLMTEAKALGLLGVMQAIDAELGERGE